MTRMLLATAAAFALAGGLAFADDQDVKARAEELVRQLGSDDVAERERATEELSKLGTEAIPVLEEAAKSTDAEVQWRAEKALAKIREAQQPKTQPQEKRPKQTRKRSGFSSSVRIQIIGPGRVQIRRDGSGHISVKVTEEDENGEQVTRTYEADSVEEFQEKYPEIAKKYGIEEEEALPQVELPQEFQDLDEIFEDMPARIQEMLDQMRMGRGLFPELRWWRRRPPARKPVEPLLDPQEEAASPDEFGAEVSFIDEALRDQLDLAEEQGVIVRKIADGSPAEKAGLERHDVVLSVNGEPVKSKWDFRRLLIEGASSGRVELAIVREGKRRTLDVDPALLRK